MTWPHGETRGAAVSAHLDPGDQEMEVGGRQPLEGHHAAAQGARKAQEDVVTADSPDRALGRLSHRTAAGAAADRDDVGLLGGPPHLDALGRNPAHVTVHGGPEAAGLPPGQAQDR